MRLDQFDLNLFVAFDMLMRERSVTRAAQRLNMTQPAMSAALKRLRESLGDEILVQHGKKMIPTARAMELAPAIASAIEDMRNLLASSSDFDPATSRRRFRIAASDYIGTVLIAPLIARLNREAPGIEFEIRLPESASAKAMEDGGLDLMMTPEQYVSPHHPRELLFTERHVVIGCARNAVFEAAMTPEAFAACGHVAVEIQNRQTFIEEVLRQRGYQRRIEVVAPSFLQVPFLLRDTDRLALMHERLANLLVGPFALRIAECPIALPPMNEMMQYHSARANDPGLGWLRQQFRNAAMRSGRDLAAPVS